METCPPPSLTIPPFDVTTQAAAVARFAAAVRTERDRVPPTFPISWLALPAVRGAIESLAKGGEVAVHEDQDFAYHHPLVLDRTYRLHARVERTEAPPRLLIDAGVWSGNELVVTLRTALRVVDTRARAA